MKLAWTAFVLDRGRSGIATYVLNMLQALGRVDTTNEYDVLLPTRDCWMLPNLPSHMRVVPSWPGVENPLVNIVWHHSMLPVQRWLKGYDLVHIPSVRRIPWVKSCPMVATVHDMAPVALAGKYDALRSFYHRQVLTRLIHRCDQIITVSHYTKRDMMRFTGYPEERIHVIYNGIDHRVFYPLPREAAAEALHERYGIRWPYIVYVSRVEHPGKNHLNLIKAFEQLKRRQPSDYRLVFAGPDWTGAEVVKEYAHNSAYGSEISFLGSVPREDVVRLYACSELMAFPSLFEGFGLPLLEAMSCGAPVICSNTTSLGEIAQDYAVTFDPTDPDAICEALVRVLDEDSTQRIERGKAYAATFSWDRAAIDVLKVYNKCVSNETLHSMRS